ncbi:formate--tetrahydrofolate ligase [Sulfuriroseicoccus oceanibius]|uniref:Formate--tetrahydrofolate ligase n=1 Tax=Sulfuriroseicoccus oceanibius TaxID=2707525 RepID=A0A6B3LEZ1_9BACT|nr:formate--tetrahydrofolate ligase [Sulfuriroseicoccus oceanibius]QQL45219.1 formate--tetrahydrofolate ligase [Sulfuriroseicoccus oceanibius]
MTDLEIAQKAEMVRISKLAEEKLGIPDEHLEPYGHYKAKLSLSYLDSLKERPDGKLILVTAISPTPAGEGKTTTSVGLTDALNRIGKKTVACLREPSLGPCFGLKGGAAGGGYAQVVPMEDINLHFTGDFHAIGLANNLLAAMVDNHIHHGNALGIDQRRVVWRRVVDMNDRALREITVALGGLGNGFPRTDGFDIVVASEVMAIFCLATSRSELKQRLGNIIVGYTRKREPIRARDLDANGAMAALLKDAFKPNIVQTLEGNIAFVHGGPFANIAHGCNSVIATKSALKLADYVVTEAGFGADLGAEKFVNIKCRKSGLRPDVAVVVATIRALKYHGGQPLSDLTTENLEALEVGSRNLKRHVRNIRERFGLPAVVAINRFSSDTDAEIEQLKRCLSHLQVKVVLAEHWEKGGAGAEELAHEVLNVIDDSPSNLRFIYDDNTSLWEKMETVATRIYGASKVVADTKVHKELKRLEDEGFGNCPVCVAKTPYSFSTDPKLLGAPEDHVVKVREVRLAAGAEFVVMICGDVMTMPGLPKQPAAARIDLSSDGRISGLF